MAKDIINTAEMIVIGGSAGSLEVMLEILPLLPANYPIPLLIIMHRNNSGDSMLRDLLARKSKLIVKEIEEKDPVDRGHIYLVPADYHVLIEQDKTFSLDYSEKVNYSRPSIDVTMMSAAEVFQEKMIGILLSGANDDGAEGMRRIKEKGGYSVVQDPKDASADIMPRQAMLRSRIDAVLSGRSIADFLVSLG